jgi:NAD-dependent protein deacetylase/lipoamidase
LKFSDDFIAKIKNAKSVVFFTGAGISTESGIPTFRGKDGIWNKLKPEELANFNAFLKNPDLVWEWYQHRKKIVHESNPNPAHIAIAEMQELFPEVIVITQNIDNLHRRAGNKIIFELHGNIERNYCIKCHKYYNEEPEDKLDFSHGVPKCECGGLIRPDVVWFGEYLPQDQFRSSENASIKADIFFIVGTSAVVFPAASLIYTAKTAGAYLIEVNTDPSGASEVVNDSFYGQAGDILPQIKDEIKKILKK